MREMSEDNALARQLRQNQYRLYGTYFLFSMNAEVLSVASNGNPQGTITSIKQLLCVDSEWKIH